MTDYASKQTAYWGLGLAVILGVVGIVLAAGFAPGPGERVFAGVLVFLALLIANFAVLTVRVTDAEVQWAFGIGINLFSKRLRLDEVRGVELQRTPWYWGWGIRWTPRGWLWRSTGLETVWLALANGKQVGVGSPDPDGLARAVRSRTPSTHPLAARERRGTPPDGGEQNG